MPRRRVGGGLVFMALWLAVWGAAMLIVAALLVRAAIAGDFGAAPFLALWLGFAALGLYAGVRRVMTTTGLAAPPEPDRREPPAAVWKDDMPPRADGAGEAPTGGRRSPRDRT